MSDEPTRLAEGMTPVSRERFAALGHHCEHAGCSRHADFGFARPRQKPHWFCFEHRADGEAYI